MAIGEEEISGGGWKRGAVRFLEVGPEIVARRGGIDRGGVVG